MYITLNHISISVLLQCFFSINHMVMLILGSILGYYILPIDMKYWATLPPALMLFSAFIFIPLSRKILSVYGHKIGFFIGSLSGLIGACFLYNTVIHLSFGYLLMAAIFFGIHQSYTSFLRYIAADDKPCCQKTNAVAAVIIGSVLAAIITPLLVQFTQDINPVIQYSATTIGIIIVNIISVILSLGVSDNKEHDFIKQNKVSWQDLKKFTGFKAGTIVALGSNGIMHFLMLATPLAIIGCGLTVNEVGLSMQMHILAMLLPAFVIGTIIQKFGLKLTLILGILCFLITLPLFYYGYVHAHTLYFQIGMMTMGLGWGILYIAGTGIITLCYCPCDASGVQSKAEMIITGGTGLLSVLAGAIYTIWDWQGVLICVFGMLIIMSYKVLAEKFEQGIVNQSHRTSKFQATASYN